MKKSNLIIVVFILAIAVVFGLAKFSPLGQYLSKTISQQQPAENQEENIAKDDSASGDEKLGAESSSTGDSTSSGQAVLSSQTSVSNGVAESKAEADGQVSHEVVLTATQDGQNAFELLREVADIEYEDYGDAGYFVTSINGTKSDDSHYWAFYVNGEYSNTGVSQTTLELGDEVKFVFEEVDESAL